MSEALEVTKAQYESLIKKMDIMQDTMDRRFAEWSDDRKTINDLEARMKMLEAKLDGARDEIKGSQDKIVNKVEERLQPIPDVVEDAVKEAVKKKKGLFK